MEAQGKFTHQNSENSLQEVPLKSSMEAQGGRRALVIIMLVETSMPGQPAQISEATCRERHATKTAEVSTNTFEPLHANWKPTSLLTLLCSAKARTWAKTSPSIITCHLFLSKVDHWAGIVLYD
jgi:hypothetical protein